MLCPTRSRPFELFNPLSTFYSSYLLLGHSKIIRFQIFTSYEKKWTFSQYMYSKLSPNISQTNSVYHPNNMINHVSSKGTCHLYNCRQYIYNWDQIQSEFNYLIGHHLRNFKHVYRRHVGRFVVLPSFPGSGRSQRRTVSMILAAKKAA